MATFSNPLNLFKNTVNNASNVVAQTYTTVSQDVSNTVSQIVPPAIIRPNNILKPEIKQEINMIVQELKPEFTPFEKQIQSLYIGCYSDDPSNPSMEKDLGDVSNSLECIELGKKNNYKYVGLQQGNRCFASNNIPSTSEVDRKENCNVGCDDINTGNCGGFFYNQVYKTALPDVALNFSGEKINIEEEKNKNQAENMLEKFATLDTEVEKINFGLSHATLDCIKPVNSFDIFFWLVILIILLYLLFEYIYKKSQK